MVQSTGHHDSTPHVYKKMEITVCYSMWIVISPHMGVSGIVNFTVSKLCFVSEYNVVMRVGVCIKATAEFQPPTLVPRFKMLNYLYVVWVQSFIM
jgi:hypothetical protein